MEYIEREKVVLELSEAYDEIDTRFPWVRAIREAIAAIKNRINAMPAADATTVRHGYWEGVFQDGVCSWSGKCSVCGARNDIPHPIVAHYCPNCGAKMDGGNKDG